MLIHKAGYKRVAWTLVCAMLLLGGGCRYSWPLAQTKVDSSPSPAQMKLYRQAVAHYNQKTYNEAALAFESVRTQTSDKRLALMALYGLACSKLMVAGTPDQYNDAIQLWQNWVDNAPDTFNYENPVMFDALLKEKMLYSNLPLTSGKQHDDENEPMVSRWLLVQSKEELDRLRAELEAARKNLEKRKKTIQAHEKKIAELKRQIKALETIDQKIQKKKNAIPSAESNAPR